MVVGLPVSVNSVSSVASCWRSSPIPWAPPPEPPHPPSPTEPRARITAASTRIDHLPGGWIGMISGRAPKARPRGFRSLQVDDLAPGLGPHRVPGLHTDRVPDEPHGAVGERGVHPASVLASGGRE